MGSSGSKVAQSATRKFPNRAPGTSPPTSTSQPIRSTRPSQPPRPQQRAAPPRPSFTKNDAIRRDSINPDQPEPSTVNPNFASRLKQMGIAQPNPTFSPSSTASTAPPDIDAAHYQGHAPPQFPPASSNVTLGVLEARRQLELRAEDELNNIGKSSDQGKEFLDIATIRNILVLRQRGESASTIEIRLRLKPGVVGRLGPLGIVAPAS
ncbi:hypothetical protein B0T22DRAFT_437965 [Podospora appendiculata]|uniref:Helix-turn-helix domain-containing protein n=1 Tax=Podospora appendiculata TaxID=314037 RepID=A0AAE0XK89_9PEZI|nr:hypothetical protein B0T22DRAFT_437965 [Podospora appendiculata]